MNIKPQAQTNAERFARKRDWHARESQRPIKEKVRILLQLQKQDLPILAARRALKWHEKPWDIEP